MPEMPVPCHGAKHECVTYNTYVHSKSAPSGWGQKLKPPLLPTLKALEMI